MYTVSSPRLAGDHGLNRGNLEFENLRVGLIYIFLQELDLPSERRGAWKHFRSSRMIYSGAKSGECESRGVQ